MYKKKKNISTYSLELGNYIEGFDLYNAQIMDMLRDKYKERVPYEIRTYEYRPDLIAKDIYGSENYTGLFLLTCGVGLSGLKKGAVLSILPKDVVDNIIAEIQRYG